MLSILYGILRLRVKGVLDVPLGVLYIEGGS